MATNRDPVILEGRTISNTWWGKSWCKNLESYADYSNRIARGKSYVRNGTVLDLQISKGQVQATVQGSRARPYKVKVDIDVIEGDRKDRLISRCGRGIESLDALLSGDISDEIADIFVSRDGLFPTPREIMFHCSCPDSAYMCKHVAATLYGVASRFDKDPLLFFQLRGVDADSLVRMSVEERMSRMLKNADRRTSRMLDDKDISSLFGVLD